MLVIDTHAHLFSEDERRYPPRPDPSRPPQGTGTISHLRREMKAAGVRAVCAVQVSGFYRFDNRYILDSSKANPDWIAGVITLDPDDPESPGLLAQYADEYGIRGMRSIPAGDGRLDHPGVRNLWQAAFEHGVVVNLLVGHEHAPEADKLLQEFRELPVVLDHNLQLQADGDIRATLTALGRLAKRPNCHTKMSSIANGPRGCADGFPCKSFYRETLKVIDMFGPERCAWGAHFPLEKYAPALTYAEHLRIFTEVLPLSEQARAQIVGGTANRLWFGGRLR